MYTDIVLAPAKRFSFDPSLETVCLFSLIGLALSVVVIPLLPVEAVATMLALIG